MIPGHGWGTEGTASHVPEEHLPARLRSPPNSRHWGFLLHKATEKKNAANKLNPIFSEQLTLLQLDFLLLLVKSQTNIPGEARCDPAKSFADFDGLRGGPWLPLTHQKSHSGIQNGDCRNRYEERLICFISFKVHQAALSIKGHSQVQRYRPKSSNNLNPNSKESGQS